MLEAIEDELIEVEKLRTGKEFSLGNFFDEVLSADDE